MPRAQIIWRKDGAARFLSHLDVLTTLEFSLRRAGVPVALSAGFSPRPRISVAAPLPVGYEGEREIVDITLREAMAVEDISQRLRDALPGGFSVVAVALLPDDSPPAASRLRAAVYRVCFAAPVPDLEDRIATLWNRERIDIEEPRGDGVRRRDVRPLLLDLAGMGDAEMRCTVRMDTGGSVRPDHLLTAMGLPVEGARMVREKLILT